MRRSAYPLVATRPLRWGCPDRGCRAVVGAPRRSAHAAASCPPRTYLKQDGIIEEDRLTGIMDIMNGKNEIFVKIRVEF